MREKLAGAAGAVAGAIAGAILTFTVLSALDDKGGDAAAVRFPTACENFAKATMLYAGDGAMGPQNAMFAPGADMAREQALDALLESCYASVHAPAP